MRKAHTGTPRRPDHVNRVRAERPATCGKPACVRYRRVRSVEQRRLHAERFRAHGPRTPTPARPVALAPPLTGHRGPHALRAAGHVRQTRGLRTPRHMALNPGNGEQSGLRARDAESTPVRRPGRFGPREPRARRAAGHVRQIGCGQRRRPQVERFRARRRHRAAGHVRQTDVRPAPPLCSAEPRLLRTGAIPGERDASNAAVRRAGGRRRPDHANRVRVARRAHVRQAGVLPEPPRAASNGDDGMRRNSGRTSRAEHAGPSRQVPPAAQSREPRARRAAGPRMPTRRASATPAAPPRLNTTCHMATIPVPSGTVGR